jgi:acyl dehydratase
MTETIPRNLDLKDLAVGDSLPTFHFSTPQVEDCVAWMEAGDEFHAMHSDADYARSMGAQDIVVPGLLLMAHLGRYVLTLVPRDRVRELGGRFESICYPSDELSIDGTLADKFAVDGELRARLDFIIADRRAGVRVRGDATVALG